jgi:anti-sigma factor RsiW
MSCVETRRRLDDFLDDALTPLERREVEAHLNGCPKCRAELASVGALLDTVADLKERKLEPGRDLWPSIRFHLADPTGRARRSWRSRLGLDTPRFVWQFAGAALVLVVGIGLGAAWLARSPLFTPGGLLGGGSAAVADTSAAGLPRQLASLDAEVSVTRGEVRAVVSADSAAAGSWEVFDQNLQLLDSAIRDSRAALARDPDNPILQKSLLSAYQKQLELLRWASRLVHQG